jgi:diaminohydroxyphosphoribosylaminopyrimidine deaminase / 5-amino-6-(5-phosphoribosylamino)uracil reductase
MSHEEDQHFMQVAINEAKKGFGRTSPNPCVGAVLVQDGRIISKGYHKKAGSPHAEINAIKNAREAICGATLYVTLEPCNHTGRTPPCSHAIVEHQIARVVIGMRDPNPIVNGSGIEYLKHHRVALEIGVLEQQCQDLNRPFIKHITTGLPWIIMKAGVSLDGRLNYQQGATGWITGDKSIKQTHILRDQVDAILVGRGTITIDNPMLTTRLSNKNGKDPIRVIIDSQLSSPLTSKVYNLDSASPTWVFHTDTAPKDRIIAFERAGMTLFEVSSNEKGLSFKEIFTRLGAAHVSSVLVEGGATIHGTLLRNRFYDYAHLFYAPIFAGDSGGALAAGLNIPDRMSAPALDNVRVKRLGLDIMISGSVVYPASSPL